MSKYRRRDVLAASLAGAAALAWESQAGAQLKKPAAPKAPVTVAPPGVKIFSRVPRSATEVAAAHLNARDQGVEFLGPDEPLELNSFVVKFSKRDVQVKGKDPNPSTRRFVLSVGIEVNADDQIRLPALSKGKIIEYLDSHFVSVQARIQRDARGSLYLHQRPVVATGKFKGARLTEGFDPAVANSVREIHSLGVFVPAKVDPTPANLRTAVLIHRHMGLDAAAAKGGVAKVEPHYEFMIIRGREAGAGAKLDLHCFVTSDERTRLHYLKPNQRQPLKYEDCSLRAQVYFSKYKDGLIPAESVTRTQQVSSQGSFLMADVDAFVKTQLKLNDTLTNLNEALDAIIDGKLRPAARVGTGSVAQPKVGSTTTPN